MDPWETVEGQRRMPPGSPGELAATLRRLAEDGDAVAALAQTARRHAREHFTSVEIVGPLEARLRTFTPR